MSAPKDERGAQSPSHDAEDGPERSNENPSESQEANESAPENGKKAPAATHLHVDNVEQAEEIATQSRDANTSTAVNRPPSPAQDAHTADREGHEATPSSSCDRDQNVPTRTEDKRAPYSTQRSMGDSDDDDEVSQWETANERAGDGEGDQIVRTDESQHLHYITGSSRRVLPWSNPNSRRYAVDNEAGQSSGNEWEWWSRENRKGRHILLLNQGQSQSSRERTTRFFRALVHMATVIAWWDVSWWVGVTFTLGSACSVTAGVLQWLLVAYPDKTYAVNTQTVAGILSFIRGWLFLAGGILLVIEAVNANQTDCFGWALKDVLNDDSANFKFQSSDEEEGNGLQKTTSGYQPDRQNCTHIHNPARLKHKILHTKKVRIDAQPTPSSASSPWKWWPTWRDIRYHYIREIGFVANFVLFIGTAVFWITNLLSIPGLYDILPQGVMYGLYYLTFVVGALCFLVASVLYVLEAQRDWWKPMPRMVGWWVGMTNLVGSVGWVYSASLGYCSASWCTYQSELALVWAPAIYFIGSVLLVYEAVEKWPVHSDS